MHRRNTELSHPHGGYGSGFFDWIHILFVAVVLVGFVSTFAFQIMLVQQSSMLPTVEHGSRLFVSRTAYLIDEPECGDVIVFYSRHTRQNYVKRIIGKPGDTVVIEDGKVSRNGSVLHEPYIKESTDGSFSITVPEGMYFCMGDNRNVSIDSRDETIGCVARGDIEGKVIFSVYPFKIIE